MNVLLSQVFRGVYSVLQGKHSVNDLGLDSMTVSLQEGFMACLTM